MDELIDKPTNAITEPAKANSAFVAIKDCCSACLVSSRAGSRKAPSLAIPEGPAIPKGSRFDVEQIIYTADGTWLRVSAQTLQAVVKDKAAAATTGWVCAEPREMDPFCIPAASQLYVSLWSKGGRCSEG